MEDRHFFGLDTIWTQNWREMGRVLAGTRDCDVPQPSTINHPSINSQQPQPSIFSLFFQQHTYTEMSNQQCQSTSPQL
jgi:hypothetical protein